MGKKSKPSVPTSDLSWHTIITITSPKRGRELIEDASTLDELFFGHEKVINSDISTGVITIKLPGRVVISNGRKTHNSNSSNGNPAYLTALCNYLNSQDGTYRTKRVDTPLQTDSYLNVTSSGY